MLASPLTSGSGFALFRAGFHPDVYVRFRPGARPFLVAKKSRKKHALNLIQGRTLLTSHFVVPCAAQPNTRWSNSLRSNIRPASSCLACAARLVRRVWAGTQTLSAWFRCLLLLFGCHTRPDLVSMVVCCVASRRAWVDSSVKHWNDKPRGSNSRTACPRSHRLLPSRAAQLKGDEGQYCLRRSRVVLPAPFSEQRRAPRRGLAVGEVFCFVFSKKMKRPSG